jgi:hypothetical protein
MNCGLSYGICLENFTVMNFCIGVHDTLTIAELWLILVFAQAWLQAVAPLFMALVIKAVYPSIDL